MSGIALALIVSGVVVIRGALKGLNPVDAFRDIFDRSTGGTGITGGKVSSKPSITATGSNPDLGLPQAVERWRPLVTRHFPPNKINEALSVMHCESRGNEYAKNPLSQASGLFQHLPKFWQERSQRAGVPGANIFDPESNVKVAAWLNAQTGHDWQHWSCKPSQKARDADATSNNPVSQT